MIEFGDLEKSAGQYLDKKELKILSEAFNIAQKAHQGQKRKTGEDFIYHPLTVAYYLSLRQLDINALSAALLHDTVEDTDLTLNEIKQKFGREIANLVDGVTKLGRIKIKKSWIPFLASKKIEMPEFERQLETLRKMALAMARDIRVILIKLYDRLHNTKTIIGIAPEKRKRFAKETLEIFAPIAYRLGMHELKNELENYSFPYVYPEEYKWLKNYVNKEVRAREKYLNKVKALLAKKLDEYQIHYRLSGRIKHLYSLYLKLQRVEGDMSRVYDLIALRIIVGSVPECYKVLGIIHSLWKPLPNQFGDFIALPKPNGYQSLHTKVWCLNNKIVEFQIRTKKMHEEAEFGIAAHWLYHEKKTTKINHLKIPWIEELAKWQKKVKDSPEELKENLSLDFFKNRIFVFTPKGDVKDLPILSTPIDFAYAVHTDIGNRCIGARVNNRIVALDHELQSGEIIEIIVSKKEQKPKSDWLKLAHTHHARGVIKKRLKEI